MSWEEFGCELELYVVRLNWWRHDDRLRQMFGVPKFSVWESWGGPR